MTKENIFSSKMTALSDKELKEYIVHRDKYQTTAVQAAIWELEKRNVTGEGLQELERKLEQEKVEKEERFKKKEGLHNITDNPNAPMLYRDKFILFYGTFFSVLAGGILMAINFSKLGLKKYVLPVVIVSIAYVIAQILVLEWLSIDTNFLVYAVSLLGMYLLELLFWKKHTDPDLKYRKRPVWGAIIIALIITVPLIILTIWSQQ